jgi:hypothetical protein
MVPLLKRSSFWNLVVQSLQIGLGSFQAIAMSNEKSIEDYNIIIAGFQGLLGIIGLWTRDTNRNNVIDIAEESTETTITVESSGPVTIKDVKTEKTD